MDEILNLLINEMLIIRNKGIIILHGEFIGKIRMCYVYLYFSTDVKMVFVLKSGTNGTIFVFLSVRLYTIIIIIIIIIGIVYDSTPYPTSPYITLTGAAIILGPFLLIIHKQIITFVKNG